MIIGGKKKRSASSFSSSDEFLTYMLILNFLKRIGVINKERTDRFEKFVQDERSKFYNEASDGHYKALYGENATDAIARDLIKLNAKMEFEFNNSIAKPLVLSYPEIFTFTREVPKLVYTKQLPKGVTFVKK